MEQAAVDFLTGFARSIISKDYDAAYAMFTPGLQGDISKEKLQQVIEENLRSTGEAWGVEELVYPGDFEISSGFLTYDDLLKDDLGQYTLFHSSDRIPPGITRENYRYWGYISFVV